MRAARQILTLDALISFLVGLCAFYAPHAVGDFVFQRQTDGVHWHLIRCVGGQLLAGAVFFYRFRNRSLETQTAAFIMRILSCVLIVFLLLRVKSQQPELINPLFRVVLVYFSFACIALYFFMLTAAGWRVGDSLDRDAYVGNALYQLDTMASVVIGLAWIAHPKWLLHRQVNVPLDESHELCGRVMGALFVASKVLAERALHWQLKNDRLMAAEARALCCLFILCAQIWSQIAYKADWSGAHWVGISLFSTWTLIAVSYRLTIFFTSSRSSTQHSQVSNIGNKSHPNNNNDPSCRNYNTDENSKSVGDSTVHLKSN